MILNLDDNLKAKLAELQPKAAKIQGWIGDLAGINLYYFARYAVRTPTVVELGSWKGRSTLWLASAMKDRGAGHLYCVDTWEGTKDEPDHAQMLKDYDKDQLYNEFLGNMESNGLTDTITPLRGTTTQWAGQWGDRGPIGMLFIDAGHSYEDVRSDFERWTPFVERGGIIVFDDVPGWVGPSQLVTELPAWYRFVFAGEGQWVVRKF